MQKSTAVPRFGERRCLVDVGILMYLGDISEVWLGQRFGGKMSPKSFPEHPWGTERA